VSYGPAYGAPRFVQAPPQVHVRPSQIEVAPPQVHFVDAPSVGQAYAPDPSAGTYPSADPQAYQLEPVYI
jgi:hypothetical protein